MDYLQILAQLAIITLTSLAIMYACDTFELGSRFIGGHLPQGIRGATINAIGSSLPELFTAFFLLFIYHHQDGYSASIATCAGSAIFNAVVIPGLCIITVLFLGVKINGKHQYVKDIEVHRSVFLRDAFFFALSCIVLIGILSSNSLSWEMGALLIGLYFLYIGYIYIQYKFKKLLEEDEDDEEEEETPPQNVLTALLTLNFRWLLFREASLTKGKAWLLLAIGTVAIAIPCHFLAAACVKLAKLLHVHPFYTAVIFAAAATSVPDTILSIKDARQGDYDDAISNAFGSNIFDINIGLGLPLLLYGLFYGNVELKGVSTPSGESVAAVQELQIFLFLITLVVLGIFLIGKKLGKVKAILLFSLYGIFLSYCVGRAYNVNWLEPISQWLRLSL